MHTVLLADDDKDLMELLARKIGEDSAYQVIAKLYDGKDTIEQIERLRPDIVFLDIVMPGSDGVHVVNHIRQRMRDYRPIIYILSGIGTSNIVKTLNALDVDFYSLKPVSLDIIMQNLNTIVDARAPEKSTAGTQTPVDMAVPPDTNSQIVKQLTLQLGLLPHRISTLCLNDALLYCMENPNGTHLITKILYPEVARMHGLTGSSVEKNIRQSITTIQKANTATYNRIFSYANGKRITNGEFLSVVTEHIGRQKR